MHISRTGTPRETDRLPSKITPLFFGTFAASPKYLRVPDRRRSVLSKIEAITLNRFSRLLRAACRRG